MSVEIVTEAQERYDRHQADNPGSTCGCAHCVAFREEHGILLDQPEPETVGKMRLLDHGAHCASCYLQEDVRHVDFGAAYDGPVLEGSIKVTIDDLIVCENCLRTAVALLGITADVEELQDELRLANAERMELRERNRGLEDYNGKLEQAITAKEKL